MIQIVTTILSVALAGDETAAGDAPVKADAKAELVALCAKAHDAESYAFELTTEGSGGGRGGFGRGGRGGDRDGEAEEAREPQAPPVLRYRAGLPVHVKQGDLEAYVLADTTVFRETADGEWQLYDRESMRGRFGRGGGGRGGRGDLDSGDAEQDGGGQSGDAQGGSDGDAREGGDRRGGRSGRGGGRRGGVFGLLRVTRSAPPHELLADIEGKVTDVVHTTSEDGTASFTGKLTPEAARGLMSMGFGRGGRGGGGRGGFGGGGFGDGEGPDISGTFAIHTDGQGAIASVVIDTHMEMEFGDRFIERDSKTTYRLFGWNATDFEVPEDALIHFEF